MIELANNFKKRKKRIKLLENKVTSECYFIIFIILLIVDIYRKYMIKQDSYFLVLILGLEVYKTIRLSSIGGYDSTKKKQQTFQFFIFYFFMLSL